MVEVLGRCTRQGDITEGSRERTAIEKPCEVISESNVQKDEAGIISGEGAMAGAETKTHAYGIRPWDFVRDSAQPFA